MIKTVFIGNRPKVYEALLAHPSIELIKVFAIDQPHIPLDGIGDRVESIHAKGEKKKVVDFLKQSDYQLCVSAGCSYILPMSELPKDRIFINCHPSALPLGRGIHPLNECFLSSHQTIGVSIHHLIDELDAGNVIEQISFSVTDDLDVSLLYGFIFDLEAELLVQGIDKLLANSMVYPGAPQNGEGTYFSRSDELVSVFASQVTCETFLKNVRAYSSRNLGLILHLEKSKYRVFSAREIINPFVINRFSGVGTGTVCIKTSEVVVVKLADGLVRLDSWLALDT